MKRRAEKALPPAQTRLIVTRTIHAHALELLRTYGHHIGLPAQLETFENSKRKTCSNGLSVREEDLRKSLLRELRHRLASDDAIAYARKRIAERLGELSREEGTERKDARASLEKIQGQINRLVDAIAEGTASKSVNERLRALERDATQKRRALDALEKARTTPIRLPTPDEMMALVLDLETRLTADVARGREELRHLFRNGRIDLVPQPGGFYVAKSELLPLVLLTKTPAEGHSDGRDHRYIPTSCAGRI